MEMNWGERKGKRKRKEEEGEQKEHFTFFYKEEGIGTGGRERGDRGGSGYCRRDRKGE